MRIKGIDKSKPNVEVVIFPRSDSDDVVIKATAVISYDRFTKLVKEPVLQESLTPGGKKEPSTAQRESFTKETVEYYDKRHGFMLFETLKGNDCIDWGDITENDPNSWLKCVKEIDTLPLADAEQNRLISAIHRANGMSDALLEEAEQSFLAREASAKLKRKSSQSLEVPSSISGAVAKD